MPSDLRIRAKPLAALTFMVVSSSGRLLACRPSRVRESHASRRRPGPSMLIPYPPLSFRRLEWEVVMPTPTRHAIAVLALLAALGAAGTAGAQTTLTMSSWVSPQHHLTSVVLQGWANEVEKATAG